MNRCCDIVNALPDYLNNKTTKAQNIEIVRHVSICPSCRKDLALWISAQEALKSSEEEVPSDIFYSMFGKLPADDKTELEKIIEANSITMALDVVRYVFEAVRTTYKLASLF